MDKIKSITVVLILITTTIACGNKAPKQDDMDWAYHDSVSKVRDSIDMDSDGVADFFGNMSESTSTINMSNGATNAFKTLYNNKTYYIYDDSAH